MLHIPNTDDDDDLWTNTQMGQATVLTIAAPVQPGVVETSASSAQVQVQRERERERQRERDRQRETDRDRDRDRERETKETPIHHTPISQCM
jgi:Ni/Co efflux regulator RcnB